MDTGLSNFDTDCNSTCSLQSSSETLFSDLEEDVSELYTEDENGQSLREVILVPAQATCTKVN